MKNKTLRLIFPEWQGGVNPPYYEGSRILDMIAPRGEHMECAEVPVKTNFADTVPVTHGIAWENELMEQAPFDYLH